jgi:glycosyltransferase involved in cell wall biosynthesis
VISVELGARSFQAALFRQLRPSVPLVIWCKLSEHTERGFGRVRDALRRFILRRADAVVVNGESGARYIAKFGVPDHAILRLNQPVDLKRFADAADRARAAREATHHSAGGIETHGLRRLLIVGTLNDRKGVLPFAKLLIDWANARNAEGIQPEREVIWLGDGERRSELEQLAWPACLRPVFLGNRAYDEVPEIYAAADALAFPTMLDEWGLVVNEAMAAGLPVLGSIYAQAVDELVEDGVTGWRFDPASPASVIGALDRAMGASPETLSTMRVAAQQRISGVTPEATAQRFVALLTRLVSAQPHRSRLVALRREEMN